MLAAERAFDGSGIQQVFFSGGVLFVISQRHAFLFVPAGGILTDIHYTRFNEWCQKRNITPVTCPVYDQSVRPRNFGAKKCNALTTQKSLPIAKFGSPRGRRNYFA